MSVHLDPVSALLLDQASVGPSPSAPATPRILVADDPVLANHLHAAGHPVRAYCDDLQDERELVIPPLESLDEATLAGVELVLLRLPKSLGMLEDYAQRIAAFAAPGVRLLAGGREKHLTRGMNEVLARSFGDVRASLGRQKSRVLHAGDPTPSELSWPHTTTLDDLTLVSHAGAFAADKLDGGTRLLLQTLTTSGTVAAAPSHAVDLGCGTGILATWLARRGYDTLAVDVSRAACASARDTAAANDVQVEVSRADSLIQPPASVDLVVCNPPFHRGTTKDSTPGFDLIRSAVPALASDAEFWTVFNSQLPYLPFLRTEIGPTRVIARDRHYTVTRSLRTRRSA